MIAAPFLSSSPKLIGPRAATRPLSARSPSFRAHRFSAIHSGPSSERLAAVFTSAPPSLYEVLGIPTGATAKEIKAAYRTLARACHPDAGREGTSADEFMRIHDAYATLSDPGKRADYDRKQFILRRRHRSSASSPPRFSGYSRRAWETDQCW